MSDAEKDLLLMLKITQQDQEALSALYDQYGTKVYSLAAYILKDRLSAEEVTQDVFLKVWQKAYTWDPEAGKLVSWLLTITRRQAIDILRREQRAVDVLPTPVDDMPIPTAGRGAEGWTDKVYVQRLLAQLDEKQLQVMWLSFFRGMSHREIAETLNLPLGTVKSRLRAGVQSLRSKMRKEREA